MSRETLLRTLGEVPPQDIAAELAGDRGLLRYEGVEEGLFFDTFDGRLGAEGMRFELVRRPGARDLLRTRTRTGLWIQPSRWVAGDSDGSELPAGVLGRRMARLIGERRLLLVARVKRRVRSFEMADEQQKVVAVVSGESGEASLDTAARSAVLPGLVRLVVLRGFEAAGERLQEAAASRPDLEVEALDDQALAGAALGLDVAAAKRRLPHLHAETRADRALKQVLLSLLEVMAANELGVRDDLDSEFLHDFRVATRRTRVALGQLEKVLDREEISGFKTELRWLGEVTGPTRDLDVFLTKVPGYRESLPPSAAAALRPLEELVAARRRKEQRRLAGHLESPRYRRLLEEWRSFLERPVPGEATAPEAGRPILEVAAKRIRRALARVVEDGRAIGPLTPATALHRLRIDCKKLRYLLELFRSLFRGEEADRLVKNLKRLQDNLGDLNDFSVQQVTLRAFAAEMTRSGRVEGDTLLAMGRLLAHLEEGEAKERRRFQGCFATFASDRRLVAAARLLGGPAERGGE